MWEMDRKKIEYQNLYVDLNLQYMYIYIYIFIYIDQYLAQYAHYLKKNQNPNTFLFLSCLWKEAIFQMT